METPAGICLRLISDLNREASELRKVCNQIVRERILQSVHRVLSSRTSSDSVGRGRRSLAGGERLLACHASMKSLFGHVSICRRSTTARKRQILS